MWNNASTDAETTDHHVLIVEDEWVARHALAALLAGAGYSTRAAASAESAFERIHSGERLEIALVDLDLPGMNGAEFIARLAAQQPWVFSVLISAASPARVASVLAEGVPYLRKPLDFQELLKVLDAHSRSH
jgi:CheY-like chemotaxis protein